MGGGPSWSGPFCGRTGDLGEEMGREGFPWSPRTTRARGGRAGAGAWGGGGVWTGRQGVAWRAWGAGSGVRAGAGVSGRGTAPGACRCTGAGVGKTGGRWGEGNDGRGVAAVYGC
ncbi:hypothetical protein GCM10010357_11720 [Streptomyces luteireticuli]|uniref:Uncharacterized protein n=1 Tax=Streptomyces luteireticuli TaxID=173858 RepID=A0ABN0YE68_9ACTN